MRFFLALCLGGSLLCGCNGRPAETPPQPQGVEWERQRPTATPADLKAHIASDTACIKSDKAVLQLKTEDKWRSRLDWAAVGFGILAVICAVGFFYLPFKKLMLTLAAGFACAAPVCLFTASIIHWLPYIGAGVVALVILYFVFRKRLGLK